jgi:hypothetical protein
MVIPPSKIQKHLACKHRPPYLKPRSYARSTAASTGDSYTIQAIPSSQPAARRGRRAWRPARRTDERTGSALPVPGWLTGTFGSMPDARARHVESGVRAETPAWRLPRARHLTAGDRALSGICCGRPCRLLSANRDKATALRSTCPRRRPPGAGHQ